MFDNPAHNDFSNLPRYRPGPEVWQNIENHLVVGKTFANAENKLPAYTASESSWSAVKAILVRKMILRRAVAIVLFILVTSGAYLLLRDMHSGSNEIKPQLKSNPVYAKVQRNRDANKNTILHQKEKQDKKRNPQMIEPERAYAKPPSTNLIRTPDESVVMAVDSLKAIKNEKEPGIDKEEMFTVVEETDTVPDTNLFVADIPQPGLLSSGLSVGFAAGVPMINITTNPDVKIKQLLSLKFIKSFNHTGIETGLSLMAGSEPLRLEVTHRENSFFGIYQAVDSLRYSGRDDKLYYTHPVEVWDTVNVVKAYPYTNNFRYLGIPVMLRFMKGSDKWSFGIKSGVVFNFALFEKQEFSVENGIPVIASVPTNRYSFYPMFKSSLFAGYTLSEKLRLEIEPYFMSNLRSQYRDVPQSADNRIWMEFSLLYHIN